MLGICFEVIVHVDILPFVVADLFKPIHVQLPDKGGKIPMLEVYGKNFLGEASDALDCKGFSGRSPRNYVRVTLILF